MFEKFWPSFFAFLLITFLLIALLIPNELVNALVSALFVVGGFFLILFWLLVGAAVVAGLITAALIWHKARLSARRPIDGAFPLQKFRLRDGRQVLINPNTMIGPAAIIDPATGYHEIEHPAGWDIVARIREAVERTNTARAIFPGDHARTNRYGAMSDTPRLTGGAMRMIDQPPKRVEPRVIGAPQLPAPPAQSLPAIDPVAAITASPPLAPAVGATATGEIVRWDLRQFPHARWHGASRGSGKTNGAKTALAGLLRNGAHVVILDRRRFKDFGDFHNRAELIDTSNPAAFVEAMQRLEIIYRERDRILGAHQAADIDALPQRLVRYVVLITEFGTLCSVTEEAGLLRSAMGPLSRIMREAAAAGVHVMIEDQITDRWPRGIAANADGVFVGKLPANLGQAAGYYHADKLKPYQFYHAGQLFKTWHMEPLTRQLLATAPAYDPRLAVLDGVARPVADGERSTTPTPTPFTAGTNTNGTPERDAMNAPGHWDDVVADWFRAHPQALTGPPLGISDLARTMCRAETGSEASYESFKSTAHKLFHQFRRNVRLPGGERLGTDLTQE